MVSLFGEPPVHRPDRRLDSSGDSDSMNEVSPFIKRDDSSLDSIEKEFFANDSEQDHIGAGHKWQYGGTPVLSPSSLSRDSGITSSDNQLYPDSDNTDTTDSGMDSKEKPTVRPVKAPSQFSSTDDLFWRQRRGSEPASVSKEAARDRVKQLSGSAGNTADNSPEVSDQEYNLSEDTLKLIKDMHKECPSKLLNSMIPEDMRSLSRRSSVNDSNLQTHEKGLTYSLAEDETAAGSPRRQSVPSVGTGSPTFQRRLNSSRRSASSMSSSSSERMSDAQSSSSSERLHSSKLGVMPHRTEIDMAKTLQAASSNQGHPCGPNMGQHGLQPTYKKMFMNSETRGLPSRPGVPIRPRNHNTRPTHGREATPPREFFPKDATTRSPLSQSPRSLVPPKEQREKRTPSPVKRNSSPNMSITQHPKQRLSKTQSDTSSMSSSSSSLSRSTPPTYEQAMNRRALLQHQQAKSLDIDTQLSSDQSPRRRSADSNVPKHRHEERPSKGKRQIAGGIILIDSDSSEDESDYRSGNGYANGPTRNRGVRRTSSDSMATNRKSSPTTSVQRSSSDSTKSAGNEVRNMNQQRNNENTRRTSQPPPRRRHHNGDVPRRTSEGNRPLGRIPDTNSSTDPAPGRTALHFPFPDPRAEPPSSPTLSPRSKPSATDPKNGLKQTRETEQAMSQARRDWQRRKAHARAVGKDLKVGKDHKVTVGDLEKIDYTDESYV